MLWWWIKDYHFDGVAVMREIIPPKVIQHVITGLVKILRVALESCGGRRRFRIPSNLRREVLKRSTLTEQHLQITWDWGAKEVDDGRRDKQTTLERRFFRRGLHNYTQPCSLMLCRPRYINRHRTRWTAWGGKRSAVISISRIRPSIWSRMVTAGGQNKANRVQLRQKSYKLHMYNASLPSLPLD